jgi:hypothetical protein
MKCSERASCGGNLRVVCSYKKISLTSVDTFISALLKHPAELHIICDFGGTNDVPASIKGRARLILTLLKGSGASRGLCSVQCSAANNLRK